MINEILHFYLINLFHVLKHMYVYLLCLIHFHIKMADIGLGVVEVLPLQTDFGLTCGVL